MLIFTKPSTGYMTSLLVGGIPTPVKNMKVSWNDDSQYMDKCPKPPRSWPPEAPGVCIAFLQQNVFFVFCQQLSVSLFFNHRPVYGPMAYAI